jgi:hypothetical protein
VIDTAQAFFFVPTEEQRRAPVRAGVLDQCRLTGRRSEANQVLTQ